MENTQEQITHACLCELQRMVIRQANQIEDLKMDMNQLASEMRSIKDQLGKASNEITTKIAELEARITASNSMTAEVETALSELKTAAQTLDDLNPDVVPVDPAPTDPAPTDPAPTDPVPTDPAPAEPVLDVNGNPIV